VKGANKKKAEAKFFSYCQLLKVREPEREFVFHPVRKWRFDFAWKDVKVAVEIEGVTKFGGSKAIGRHQRPEGMAKDCEKYNAALDLGWVVYRFTQDLVTASAVEQVAAALKRREGGGFGSDVSVPTVQLG
jgi:hypothetical protein